MGAVLSSCLLLTSCGDKKAPAETQNIAVVLNTSEVIEPSAVPITVPTVANGIGSISTMFTTVAVMQLVDQGEIDLDNSVFQYIPEFTMKDERYKQITPCMSWMTVSLAFWSTVMAVGVDMVLLI